MFDGTQWAGTRVWKAAVLGLECLLEHYPDKQNLLELGCGLGVPGMLWHLIKESEATPDHEKENNVLLTDMPDLLPQLQENVQRNFDENGKCLPQNIGSIQAKALEWSRQGVIELLEQHPPFEICLNCDCIYEPLYGRDSWEALADVLAVVAETSPSTILVTSVERRRGDGLESFLERLAATGTVRPIERVLRNDEDKHHVIEIYVTQGNLES